MNHNKSTCATSRFVSESCCFYWDPHRQAAAAWRRELPEFELAQRGIKIDRWELKGGRYGKIGWNLSWNLIFSKYETRMTSRNVQAHGAKLKAHMRYVYISLYIIYIYIYIYILHMISHIYIYIYIMCMSIVWPPSVLTQICCPSRRTIWKPDSLMASWLASLEPSNVPKVLYSKKAPTTALQRLIPRNQ